jgi:hypothetical protein
MGLVGYGSDNHDPYKKSYIFGTLPVTVHDGAEFNNKLMGVMVYF